MKCQNPEPYIFLDSAFNLTMLNGLNIPSIFFFKTKNPIVLEYKSLRILWRAQNFENVLEIPFEYKNLNNHL